MSGGPRGMEATLGVLRPLPDMTVDRGGSGAVLRSQSASALDRPLAGGGGSPVKPKISLADRPKPGGGGGSRTSRRRAGPKKLAPLVKPSPTHFDEPPECNPPQTLLNYDAPLFVGVDSDDENEPKGIQKRTCKPDLDDMINAMLPPREWTEMTGTWMQYASKKVATRADLIALSNELDGLLRDRQARTAGYCPVRANCFQQTFDELIRQVTLDQPLLGLLLLRIRDQGRMVLDATLCVHESGSDFGMEKMIEAEPGMEDLIVRIHDLEEGNKDIVDVIMELYKKTDVLEKRAAELRSFRDKHNRDEIEALKFQGQHLDGLLRLFGPSGKASSS